jgi:hypothetical protein
MSHTETYSGNFFLLSSNSLEVIAVLQSRLLPDRMLPDKIYRIGACLHFLAVTRPASDCVFIFRSSLCVISNVRLFTSCVQFILCVCVCVCVCACMRECVLSRVECVFVYA